MGWSGVDEAGESGSAMTDDSRLDMEAFRDWFTAEGRRQVPGLPAKRLEEVHDAVAADSERRDGKVSVREVRRWFFNVFRKGKWRPGASSTGKSASGRKKARTPIYRFEVEGMSRLDDSDSAAAAVAAAASSPSPAAAAAAATMTPTVGLPGSSLLFEVELTPEEFAALSLRRRALAAEEKTRERMRRAREKASKAKADRASRDGLFAPSLSRDALQKDSAFVDADKMERFIFRNPKPDNWVAESDFRTR